MLGKPVQHTHDLERWRGVATREAQAAERRLAEAHVRVAEAERLLADARARYEVELSCAQAARAWAQRVQRVEGDISSAFAPTVPAAA